MGMIAYVVEEHTAQENIDSKAGSIIKEAPWANIVVIF